MESIASVQYQIALALLAPKRLLDVRRTPPFVNDAVRKLMAKVQVVRARDLEKHYPEAWPGRVEIRCGRARHSHTVLYPRGDWRNPLDSDAVFEKFRTIVRGPGRGADRAGR
jgi:2-methylcitrate dehydratase PrpD